MRDEIVYEKIKEAIELLDEIDTMIKMVKQLDSEYKNRVLTEEDIKDVVEPKKRVGRPRKIEESENNVDTEALAGSEDM